MRSDHSIAMLCDNLEVLPSGLYDWDRRQTYGSPKITDELRARGKRHGRNRIAGLMRSRGLCGRQKGRYRRTTIPLPRDDNHNSPVAGRGVGGMAGQP